MTVLTAVVLGAGMLAGGSTPATAAPAVAGADVADVAVTTIGDAVGLHVLAAPATSGYTWRTAATLSEPGFDTDEWIGQVCVTGSGRRAVVVYAPRQFTNRETAYNQGAFVAVVDLRTDAIRKLPLRASLAYYNPGCGSDELVAVSALSTGNVPVRSTLAVVDAARAAVVRTTAVAGQLSSAVPLGGGLVAALGDRLVSIDGGVVGTLGTFAGIPFRLHPDAAGGLAFEIPRGDQVEVHRYAAGRAQLLGTGRLDSIQVQGVAGHVFVTGPDASRIAPPGSGGWRRLGGPVDAQPSTTGALVLSRVGDHNAPTAAAAAAGRLHSPDRPDPVYIAATVTATHKGLSFTVTPAARDHAGQDASPAPRTGAPGAGGGPAAAAPGTASPQATDASTVPWDPDRACAVPRNDPTKQVFQATGQQVEWAADLAVKGALTVTRPANFRGSGMPVSWSPQSLFQLHALAGAAGHTVPAQVLLGALAQESNTMQASPHAVDGIAGNFNQGGFYGDWSSWSTADCGYGAGQVTTGMSVAEGNSVYSANQQLAIATDYASNVAASLNALIDKWNALKAANIVANDGSPEYVQNWWFALWAYNSGIQPRSAEFGNTTGCTPSPTCTDGAGNWGLGWANNPANPNYPVDRHIFHTSDQDTKTPNLWPYEELVMGWAMHPVARYNYTDGNWQWAYAPAITPTSSTSPMPGHSVFCTVSDNHCLPGGTTDINGQAGSGLCQLANLHCWWHRSITWVTCSTSCSTESLDYSPGSPEPRYTDIYPADCSTTGLPGNAIIVDDVTTPSVAPCTKTWTNQGAFSLYFPPNSSPSCSANCILYPGKIDFHQIGVGFGGHIWFTHLNDVPQVVGTWTPPTSVSGWTRIKVHIPDNGATTEMADYQIHLGDGQTRHRVVNQDWWRNTWVDIGTFRLSNGASVTLSNSNSHVAWADGRDVAYDAVAFIPSNQPYAKYVALGDSYSAGEGLTPYEPDSDQYNDGTPDSCHRSNAAYSYQVKLPGHANSVATDASNNNVADFHFLACSGAETINLSAAAVDTSNRWNTDWASQDDYHSGEPYQIDGSGWLDVDTTLVTVGIGGNDARFADILRGCLITALGCLNPSYKLTRGNGKVDPEALSSYEPKVIGALRSHLASVYQAIHLQAPNARVVVVGYPRLFDDTPVTPCQLVPPADQDWMNQMGDLLNQSINNAINDTRAAYPSMSMTFVNPSASYANHRVCDGDNWVHGIEPPSQNGSDGTGFQTPGSGSFHPTEAGQTKYATLINGIL